MKKRYIFLTIILLFIIWLLTGGYYTDTENKPIQQITKTTGIYFFGKRKIWTITKMKEVEYYNPKGQLTRHDYFNDKDSVDSRYEYLYYPFDSIYKITWLTGNDLTPQKITEYTYDNLNRLIKIYECSVNKSKYSSKKIGEIDYCELDTFQYDSFGNNNIKIIGGSTFMQKFNSNGKIIQRIHYADTSEYVTNYFYDQNGHIISEFGGLSNDSTYYKTNDKGQIIEEYQKYERYPNFISGHNKYWFDKNGNEIRTFLDIDDGLIYDFTYDKNNRLLIEYRPWNLFGLIRAGIKYDYEYYDRVP